METKFENLEVILGYRYATNDEDDYNYNKQNHYVALNFSIPGGKACYELPISKQTYDNMMIAKNLVSGGK